MNSPAHWERETLEDVFESKAGLLRLRWFFAFSQLGGVFMATDYVPTARQGRRPIIGDLTL